MNEIAIEYAKFFIPTTISLVAAIFSILTFRRNRRLENENFIYKAKHENYSKLLLEMGNLIDDLQNHFLDSKLLIEEANKYEYHEIIEVEREINLIADKIDKAIFQFENQVIANSLVIPKNVLEKLDEMTSIFQEIDIPSIHEADIVYYIKEMDTTLTKVIELSNNISELMRADLNVEFLNFSLYKRITK